VRFAIEQRWRINWYVVDFTFLTFRFGEKGEEKKLINI
jgi:hypothetical protein